MSITPAIFNNALQNIKFKINPPIRPQANCKLPINALAVPARAPCFDIAKAIAFGPVKPIPETVRNIPNMTQTNGVLSNSAAISKTTTPNNCIYAPSLKR